MVLSLSFCCLTILYITIHTIEPGPLSELHFSENTNTSVTITWTPPKEPNGVIVSYFVEYEVYQNEPTTSVTIIAGETMYTVIQDLGRFLPFCIVYQGMCASTSVHRPSITEGHKLRCCFQGGYIQPQILRCRKYYLNRGLPP